MNGKQYRYIFFLLLFVSFGITGVTWADEDGGYGDNDDYNEGYESDSIRESAKSKKSSSQPQIAPVDNQAYIDACGSCHFPFQPGLLPAKSWEKLISNLADHFGENAELAEDEREPIKSYLVNNSLEKSNYPLPKKIMDFMFSSGNSLRITKNIYIVYEHRSIPKKMLQDNPKVRSLSRCGVCHLNAKNGFYTESEVRIPGFGLWKVKVMH